METKKALTLAALTALALGFGNAMAQESPSGFTPGSAELDPVAAARAYAAEAAAQAAANSNHQAGTPQYGSSDRPVRDVWYQVRRFGE
jgi:hypothetical protein